MAPDLARCRRFHQQRRDQQQREEMTKHQDRQPRKQQQKRPQFFHRNDQRVRMLQPDPISRTPHLDAMSPASGSASARPIAYIHVVGVLSVSEDGCFDSISSTLLG